MTIVFLGVIFFGLFLFYFSLLGQRVNDKDVDDELKESYRDYISIFEDGAVSKRETKSNGKIIDVEATITDVKTEVFDEAQQKILYIQNKLSPYIPKFTYDKFISAVKVVHSIVLESYAASDFNNLKELVSEKLFNELTSFIQDLQNKNLKLQNSDILVKDIYVDEVIVSDADDKIYAKVIIQSSMCSYIKNLSTGKIEQGSDSVRSDYIEEWKFVTFKGSNKQRWWVCSINQK